MPSVTQQSDELRISLGLTTREEILEKKQRWNDFNESLRKPDEAPPEERQMIGQIAWWKK